MGVPTWRIQRRVKCVNNILDMQRAKASTSQTAWNLQAILLGDDFPPVVQRTMDMANNLSLRHIQQDLWVNIKFRHCLGNTTHARFTHRTRKAQTTAFWPHLMQPDQPAERNVCSHTKQPSLQLLQPTQPNDAHAFPGRSSCMMDTCHVSIASAD